MGKCSSLINSDSQLFFNFDRDPTTTIIKIIHTQVRSRTSKQWQKKLVASFFPNKCVAEIVD